MRKTKSATLFDVTKAESVRANPQLAKAFIRLVPPYELARIVREADFERSLLDESAIVEGILESGNPDLALVLATYGSSSMFNALSEDRLKQLMFYDREDEDEDDDGWRSKAAQHRAAQCLPLLQEVATINRPASGWGNSFEVAEPHTDEASPGSTPRPSGFGRWFSRR
jgi:hypothetical protein